MGTIVAAIIHLGVAAVWYHPRVFGRKWMALIGLKPEDLHSSRFLEAAVVTVICALLLGGLISHLMEHLAIEGAIAGMKLGLRVGIGAGIAVMAPNYLFAGRPRALFTLNAAFVAVSTGLMGLVLGLF